MLSNEIKATHEESKYDKELTDMCDWFLSTDEGKNCRNPSSPYYYIAPMEIARILIKFKNDKRN